MSLESIPLTGGESVYCINENQLKEALRLANNDPVSSSKIQTELKQLEKEMTRNERAALAFLIIDRLSKTADKS